MKKIKLHEPGRAYGIPDGWFAQLEYMRIKGVDLDEIPPWPLRMWEQEDGRRNSSRPTATAKGCCRVEFIDGDGNAKVSFPDGESAWSTSKK